tara:strand:+ start:4618 stop:5406 length:789 start_codon:yes stop_codon:yes gene_type:complete
MYIHNLDPILFDFGFLTIRWYSLAYLFGILIGWWLGRKIILEKSGQLDQNFDLKKFDDLITYLIISILIGGRLGYVFFYNPMYYLDNPIDILKIWEGGMSFHGGLIGIVGTTYIYSIREKIHLFFLLDILACVSPIGIFFGRIANFINGELVGKVTNIYWGVIFPKIDNIPRHPSQLYEALLEGVVLFFVMILIISRKSYRVSTCSYLFLIIYGLLRIFSESFREPDPQVGYIFEMMSMGTLLSSLMILVGIFIFFKRDDIK